MKKITLLLVAAVFAIGIQSCSTEEIGIEEEALQEQVELQKRGLSFSENCQNCAAVYFSPTMDQTFRDQFRDYMKGHVFSQIRSIEDGCSVKETWDLTGFSQNLLDNSGVIITEGKQVISVKDSDEETTIGRRYVMGGYNFIVHYTSGNLPILCNDGGFN